MFGSPRDAAADEEKVEQACRDDEIGEREVGGAELARARQAGVALTTQYRIVLSPSLMAHPVSGRAHASGSAVKLYPGSIFAIVVVALT